MGPYSTGLLVQPLLLRSSLHSHVVTASAVAAAAAATAGIATCASDAISRKTLSKEVQMARNVALHMDKDGDGKLSEKELDAMFELLDANKDGVISFDEWHDYLVKSGLSKVRGWLVR